MLTTKCSAGCSHCPFSDPELDKLFLNRKTIKKILARSNNKLTIFSGGEPFEHPEISKILLDLRKQKIPFRIATGGFVDLAPWLENLKLLVHPFGTLQGISMGTDVLSSRVKHSNWAHTWKNNIHLLYSNNIPYSLTFTAGNDLDFSRLNLWRWPALFKSKPEFIYLRANSIFMKEWNKKIQKTFKYIPIIEDDLL